MKALHRADEDGRCVICLSDRGPDVEFWLGDPWPCRTVQAITALLNSGPIGRMSGERYIRADYIRDALGIEDV